MSPVDTQVSALDDLIARERRSFLDRAPKATEMGDRAGRSLAGGVTSSWQISDPQPIWIDRGLGSRVWDVDGNEYVDLHGGYGAMLAGHAHPAVVAAVSERVRKGTHFAQPTADAIVVAEELTPQIRDDDVAVRELGHRSDDGRGPSHARHHRPGPDHQIRGRLPRSSRFGDGLGLERGWARLGHAAEERRGRRRDPPGDRRARPGGAVQRSRCREPAFEANEGRIAGVIVEPILQNCGILLPQPGFLQGLRDLTRKHDALLTFDEVKTGLTVGKGGATRRFGVQPDMVCLAKALGGGLPISAIGGTDEVMSHIVDGTYEQVGTFNGNPLSMAGGQGHAH